MQRLSGQRKSIAAGTARQVLLDSNLLLLLLIGSFQRERILHFKRTARFSIADFDVLATFVEQFDVIVTTPHVLTEVNGLANALPEYLKEAWHAHFARVLSSFVEVLHPAALIASASAFNPFGLTDAALQHASENALLLTEDFRLTGFLRKLGIDAWNFEDIKPLA